MEVDASKLAVAIFYEDEGSPLSSLVTSLQDFATDALDDRFTARPVAEAHATLIGLERAELPVSEQQVNGLLIYLERELRNML